MVNLNKEARSQLISIHGNAVRESTLDIAKIKSTGNKLYKKPGIIVSLSDACNRRKFNMKQCVLASNGRLK